MLTSSRGAFMHSNSGKGKSSSGGIAKRAGGIISEAWASAPFRCVGERRP